MSQTARISSKTDHLIHDMMHITKKAKIDIIEEALEIYSHYQRMRLFNEAFKNLKSNENLWNEELEFREELNKTMNDGLENA